MRKSPVRQHIAGYSLIELMISLVLGAIVTVGIIQLFGANSDTYDLVQGQSRMQEAARFAFAFIGRDIRSAGYAGCYSTNTGIYTTISPASNIPYEFDLRSAVQGYDATGTDTWMPPITDLPSTVNGTDTNVFHTPAGDGAGNGIDTAKLASGSDILTLRDMSAEYRLTQDMPTSTEPIVVATPANGFAFKQDYLAVIEDCEKATIFRITSITEGSPAAGESTIGHDINDTDPTRNSVLKLANVDTFQSDAYVGAIETNTYYVAPGTGVNNAGDTPMALWRKSGLNAPVELVQGVEDMQVTYGVDTNQDGTPNQYVPANYVADWSQVKTIRVSLTVNSVDDVGGTSTPTLGCAVQGCIKGKSYDGLIRRTFTQTFDLRNRR